MPLQRDWDHLIQRDRVHRSVYTDPELYPHEMSKLFGGLWTYLCHESQIPDVNSFKRVRIGVRDVIVTRDRDGLKELTSGIWDSWHK